MQSIKSSFTRGHGQQCGDCQGEGGQGEVEEGKGEINGDGQRLDFGW